MNKATEKSVILELTQDEWSTIYTSLLIEVNRLDVKDPFYTERVEMIKQAITAVREWRLK